MLRILESREGNAVRYWQVRITDTTCEIEQGTRGSTSQKSSKFYGSERSALNAAVELISKQKRIGYLEVEAPSGPTEPVNEVDSLLAELGTLSSQALSRVANQLARLEGLSRVLALLEAQSDSTVAVQCDAIRVLVELGQGAAPLIVGKLTSAQPVVRCEAIAALAASRALDQVEALRAATCDPDRTVRRAARTALEGLHEPVAVRQQAQLEQALRHACSMEPTHFTAKSQVETVRDLVQSGARVMACDDQGVFALFRAAALGSLELLALLLELGADVRAIDDEGRTALHHACSMWGPRTNAPQVSRQAMVEQLLSLGVDARVSADHARTALHEATVNCSGAICSLLVDAGADLEAVCDQGTPLARAAMFGNADAVAVLLGRGAQCTAKVISAAEEHEHFAVLAMLRAHQGQARGWLAESSDPLTALRALASELGTAAARSAHDSGDYAHYQDIGNDVDELCEDAWRASAMLKLTEAITALADADRQGLPERHPLLEQLENEFTRAYFEEI